MHSLLTDQLDKLQLDPSTPPDAEQWRQFLESVGQTYADSDEDRNLRAFLQQVIDVNPNFIFAKDLQSRYTLANRAFAQAYGVTVEELLGKTDADFHPDSQAAERYRAEDLAVIESRREQFIPEERSVKPSGDVFWRQSIKCPLIDAQGEVQQVLGVVYDITDLKRTQEELQRFTNQLRTAAEISGRLSTFLDPDMLLHEVVTLLQEHFDLYHVHVFMLDEMAQELALHAASGEMSRQLYESDLKIDLHSERSLIANAARQKRTVVCNDVSADPRFMPHLQLPETRAEVSIPLMISRNVIGVLDLQARQAQRFSQSDLDTFSVLASQIVIALENAHLFAEQQRVEKQIAQARDQAVKAALLKGQLLANVGHDLRTPLGAVLGHAEMLKKGLHGQLSEKQQAILQRIIHNTATLTRMVTRLMTQAQLDAGALHIRLTTFDPNELCEQIQSNMKVLADSKGVELKCSVDPGLAPALSGDFDWLYQIVANLVENALKFTEQGAVEMQLYQPDQSHWAMRVADTGPGIPAEAQEYIFEAFRQVDGTVTRRHRGSGLGLSIVKQLTTMMGGEISLQSKLGQGSAFTVLLPLIPVKEAIP